MRIIQLLVFLLLSQASTLWAQVITRGPVVHMVTENAITLRWRTDLPTSSQVTYGVEHSGASSQVGDSVAKIEHEVRLSGLTPNTKYTYQVGNLNGVLASDAHMYFTTSPEHGIAKPTRVWVIGDAGTGSSQQIRVRDAYYRYPGSAETDLFITVGDNAYSYGTEAEFQAYHFNIYKDMMKHASHAPAFGNHDGYTGVGDAHPFFQLFSFPTAGQAGSVASGQKGYYSYNYGNIHFITLDSFESSTASGSPMMTWLAQDLGANTLPWTIVYFHHAPYSRGSHDSDQDDWMSNMRRDVLPLLEAHGVDLVLGGHSHTYERSGLLNGHYGLSASYQTSMTLDGSLGRVDTGGAYSKSHYGKEANSGTVYVIAGTSGQNTARLGYHPANLISSLDSGSLILDINGDRLDATFLTDQGTVADYFTITKGSHTGNKPASISLAGFSEPASAYIGQSLQLNVSTNIGLNTVQYFNQHVLLGAGTAAPNWTLANVTVTGDLRLSALATTPAGIKSYSAPVQVKTYPALAPTTPQMSINAVESHPVAAAKLRIHLGTRYITTVNLYRATLAQAPQYKLIAQLSPSASNFDDYGVQIGESYLYRLSSANGFGESVSAPLELRIPGAGAVRTMSIIPPLSIWKYWDKGGDLGSTWRGAPGISYDDSAWSMGQGELGYGDGGETTVINYGANSSNKHITTYFRKSFQVTDLMASEALLSLRVDDGAVVFLNGHEVYRLRLPQETISANTLATAADDDGDIWIRVPLPLHLLNLGENTIAVEVHQSAPTSSDLSFDLSLLLAYGSVLPPRSITLNATGTLAVGQPINLTAQIAYSPYRHGTLIFYNGATEIGREKLVPKSTPLLPDYPTLNQHQLALSQLLALVAQTTQSFTLSSVFTPTGPGTINLMAVLIDERGGHTASSVAKLLIP